MFPNLDCEFLSYTLLFPHITSSMLEIPPRKCLTLPLQGLGLTHRGSEAHLSEDKTSKTGTVWCFDESVVLRVLIFNVPLCFLTAERSTTVYTYFGWCILDLLIIIIIEKHQKHRQIGGEINTPLPFLKSEIIDITLYCLISQMSTNYHLTNMNF